MGTMRVIASILGVLGLLFILAGPAFHLLPGPNNLWIFIALACWIIGGTIGGFAKRAQKKTG